MQDAKIYSYTRFSSEKQRNGDSVRRQIEAAEQWAKSEGRGMELDTSLRDEGVSGFYGRNAEVGALATFLTAIRNGQVASGSILLVENLDRISRHDPLKAMRVLETVVEAGVDVITLQDRRRYTRDNIAHDISNLIIALITFARGNEESRTKSKRLTAVWGNKRREAAATGKVLSTWVHPWIQVKGVERVGMRADFSKAKYVLNPERAKVVRQIFRWANQGWGYTRIAQELKARKVKTWGRAGWTITRLAKIIKNRAVIGEYQPCRYEGGAHGQRVPDGPPILDYFPRVISDNDFAAAQPIPANRPIGRPQKLVRLLSGILFDSRSRPMYVHAKAGGEYSAYITAFNRLNFDDRPESWSCEHLERCVLAACRDVNWNGLFNGQSADRDRIARLVDSLAHEEQEVMRKLGNAAGFLLEGKFGEVMKTQVQQLETKLAELTKERREVETKLEQMRRTTQALPRITIRELPTETELREKLRSELRSALTKIQVWPDGRTPDDFWKESLELALSVASPLAVHSIAKKEVMGALRLFFRNGRAITAYVTFVKAGKNRAAQVLGFVDPEGMTIEEWDKNSGYAGLYEGGAAATPQIPTLRPAA